MKTPRLTLALYALSTSVLLSGFGSCGVDPVDPIPRPCVQLSEEECRASTTCELVPIATQRAPLIPERASPEFEPVPDCICPAICELGPDGDCLPCECEPPPPTYECRPKRPDDCAQLGEEACLADPRCEPIYQGVACLRAPPAEDPCDPTVPGCGGVPLPPCEREIEFAGCQERPNTCGPVCEIYCPYGNVLDENGCATCACNPPPTGCDGLDEYQCIQHPDCRPIYGDGTDCLCAPCAPGEDCACRCGGGTGGGAQRPEPPPGEYLGCEYDQPTQCQGLDELACINTSGCRPVYDAGGPGDGLCYCPPCDPDSNEPCPGCDCEPVPPPPTFAYCEDDRTQGCYGLDERSCHVEPGCEARYSTVYVCDGGAGPDDGQGDADAGAPCDPNTGCDERRPVPCYEEVVFDGCYPVTTGGECQSDADCANGYCARRGYCDASGCVEFGYCEYPSCDDGSEVYCLIFPPTCAPGQTLAIRNGCYECVDARTCGGVTPGECRSDAECPNGYCEHYASCAGLNCPPPPPSQCVYPSCGDQSQVVCDMVPPICPAGQTAAVRNGCYECVDARTCQAGPNACDDLNGFIYCDALPPQCAPGLELAARNGCWACVEPTYCQEVSCSDGSELGCRALAPQCDPGQLLGIVNSCWACLDQNCQ